MRENKFTREKERLEGRKRQAGRVKIHVSEGERWIERVGVRGCAFVREGESE